jgi:multisubunit Na+/H+ antiporter MnhG subunit
VHPFHQLVRRSAAYSVLSGLFLIALGLVNVATEFLGGRGWSIMLLVGGTLGLSGAFSLWRLRQVPLRDEPRPTGQAVGWTAAFLAVAVVASGVIFYFVMDLVGALVVAGLVALAGAVGLVRASRLMRRWDATSHD